ncbi:MAG TPA: alpha/beta hydrolase [Candidatus Gallimonas intestinavium]|uniref:Alpha/beta hydrolase n=1 Tax=Candidatus Gallimonas intestinavium TaxID=2838603 RepID=A0A9D2G6W4_9FIRM|nr:alpha/beta hydrolase [Candidatus Gallimonas intestinavium]
MNVAYLRRGEGKDLVFLHGYLSCKESFYPQIGYFSRHFRVTAPDFPGFGKSDRIPAAWSVGDYADWLEGFFKEQGIVFPYVIAHSFGGRVALKCLARGLIDRAVLTGCAGIVKKRTMAYRIRVGGYRLVKRVSPRFAEAHFGSREYRSLSPLMRESYKKIVNEDLREEAGRIARPVLYLYGERDKETPLSSGRILHECTAGSKLAVFKGCGHFAHLEEPLLFNLAAEEFLDDA